MNESALLTERQWKALLDNLCPSVYSQEGLDKLRNQYGIKYRRFTGDHVVFEILDPNRYLLFCLQYPS